MISFFKRASKGQPGDYSKGGFLSAGDTRIGHEPVEQFVPSNKDSVDLKNEPLGWPRIDLIQGVEGSPTPENLPFLPLAKSYRQNRNRPGKYSRFLPIARGFAAMSKLPGTKVGCVVLGNGYEVLATGWNGAPRGCEADADKRAAEREERLKWVCHAEANAIANAARSGTSLLGGTMVVTLMPCMTCAKLIVQAGIVRVLCPAPDVEFNERWGEEFKLAKQLFRECFVNLVEVDTMEQKA